MNKLLFILKRKHDYNIIRDGGDISLSTGLFNSANYVVEMMKKKVESNIVVVTDNNDIDREVTKYKPTHVIIEAIWVVPEKFEILSRLHPNVKWIIRIHSELPFMAGEGMAMEWIGKYTDYKNVILAPNAPNMFREVQEYIKIRNSWKQSEVNERVIYLPNYYPIEYNTKSYKNKETIDIACFGAVRPLKNHLVQAMAAITFANLMGRNLNFHINSTRVEMQGAPCLRNLNGLFEQLDPSKYKLINHEWLPRESFIDLCATMDIGMQVSFSETFNIVSADMISRGVPIVVSKEVPWAFTAISDPTDSDDIVSSLYKAYMFPRLNVLLNQFNLKRYSVETKRRWLKYFG